MVIEPKDFVYQLAAQMGARNLIWENTPPWTKALKECLRDLLEKEGVVVIYSDSANERQEFLLDVIVRDRSNGDLVILAVESEWLQNVADVVEDFKKLLIVKASTKLMIFACNKIPRVFTEEAIWTKLSDCLLKYHGHIEGERYIFMNYAPTPKSTAWWFDIPSDGQLKVIPERHVFNFE